MLLKLKLPVPPGQDIAGLYGILGKGPYPVLCPIVAEVF
jgi:hypothetical protein